MLIPLKQKTINLRIRMLVDNIINLPNKIYLSRPFKIKHEIMYLGFPNQCKKCKKFNNMVYFCPLPKKRTKKQQLDWLGTRRCH